MKHLKKLEVEMGYYSNLDLECVECDEDRSCPSHEIQLFWRLDDLYDRLVFLEESRACYIGGIRLSNDDIRYAIPEYFDNIADVERAIELVKSDLKFQYGIDKDEREYGGSIDCRFGKVVTYNNVVQKVVFVSGLDKKVA